MTALLLQILDELVHGYIRPIGDIAYSHMAQRAVQILQEDSYDDADIEDANLIHKICNIIYNNSDRSVMPLEDGVYDLLAELCKQFNPNYQVGAMPVDFIPEGDVGAHPSGREPSAPMWFADEEYLQDSLFLYDNNAGLMADVPLELAMRSINPLDDNRTREKLQLNVPHNYPKLVGTLDKCKFVLNKDARDRGVLDDANVKIFERDFLAKHLQMGLFNTNDPITLIAELKYDGVSVEADVTNKIISARSRGDTNNDIAADYTPILGGMEFPYAPDVEKSFGMKFEAIITKYNLERLGQIKGRLYANARNAMVGLFGSTDAYRYRDFITLVPLATSIEGIDRITEIKFMNKFYHTDEYLRYAVLTGTYYEILYQVYKFVEEAEYIRELLPFMYDGVVISYYDQHIIDALGRENSVNQYQMAIKFNALKKQTTVNGCEFTVGQNGVITPMIYYSPVEFYGTIHPKSTGHSLARFNELKLKIGDVITVEYVHDVMPYVSKPNNDHNLNNSNPLIKFPTACPACGSELVITDSGKSAMCPNLFCKGRALARTVSMLDKLGIKDIGEERLKLLPIRSFYSFMTATTETLEPIGEAYTIKTLEQISMLMSKPIYDFTLVGSIGFTDVAIKTWEKILNNISLDTIVSAEVIGEYDSLTSNTGKYVLYDKLMAIKGIGDATANTIITELPVFIKDLIFINDMPNVIKSQGMSSRKSIRFTGIRDEALEKQLCDMGYDADGKAGVTKTTDILIIPDPGYVSAKTKKVGPNTTIVDIDTFKSNMQVYLD